MAKTRKKTETKGATKAQLINRNKELLAKIAMLEATPKSNGEYIVETLPIFCNLKHFDFLF